MQRCNCTVRLGGDLGNTAALTGVSPAEIKVLEAIHGEGSVVDIQPTGMDKTPHREERSRIATKYGQHVLDRLFPGEFNALPVSLSDISIGAAAEEEVDPNADQANNQSAADNQANSQNANQGEDEDDKALRELIAGAKSKADLYEIAKDNEVDLKDVPDKMDDLRAAILKGVFPNAE